MVSICIPYSKSRPPSPAQQETINARIRRIAALTGNSVGVVIGSFGTFFHFHGGQDISADNYGAVCRFLGMQGGAA